MAQRLEMVRRLEDELDTSVVELGTDGRLLTLQLHELRAGINELRCLLERDSSTTRLHLGSVSLV